MSAEKLLKDVSESIESFLYFFFIARNTHLKEQINVHEIMCACSTLERWGGEANLFIHSIQSGKEPNLKF